MQPIKYYKKNHPTLNQIFDILAELNNQDKQIILCKIPTHIKTKENEKAAKQAIDMSRITTTKLLYTKYYLIIRRARNSECQKVLKNSSSKLH